MLLRKLKVKNCIAALLILGFIFAAGMILSQEAHAEAEQEMNKIVVRSGDTLWSLAATYCESDRDIRSIIYDIRQINNLGSSEIFVGQIIYIPCAD